MNIDSIRQQLAKLSPSELRLTIEEEEEKVKALKSEYHRARDAYRSAAEQLLFLRSLLQTRSTLSSGPTVVVTDAFGKEVSSRDLEIDTIATASRKVLAAASRPLHVADIVEQLRRGSFPFRARNPERSVEVVLQREDSIFEKVKPHIFRLVANDEEKPQDT